MLLGAYAIPPLVTALRHGAHGYLPRDISAATLVRSLHGVMRGEIAMPRSELHHLIGSLSAERHGGSTEGALVRLSPRERDVLDGMSRGYTSAQIAERMCVKETTVKAHIARVLRKTGIQS